MILNVYFNDDLSLESLIQLICYRNEAGGTRQTAEKFRDNERKENKTDPGTKCKESGECGSGFSG